MKDEEILDLRKEVSRILSESVRIQGKEMLTEDKYLQMESSVEQLKR